MFEITVVEEKTNIYTHTRNYECNSFLKKTNRTDLYNNNNLTEQNLSAWSEGKQQKGEKEEGIKKRKEKNIQTPCCHSGLQILHSLIFVVVVYYFYFVFSFSTFLMLQHTGNKNTQIQAKLSISRWSSIVTLRRLSISHI